MIRFIPTDVFTGRPFEGNPLAVLLDAGGLSDTQMQTMARELKSSTTFIAGATPPAPEEDRDRYWTIEQGRDTGCATSRTRSSSSSRSS